MEVQQLRPPLPRSPQRHMDPKDLEQIDAFLSMVGQASLLEYYGISATTSADEIEARIRAQRAWAQGQQANPKFRNPALWLIKNSALVRRVLLEQMDAYVRAVKEREKTQRVSMLSLFVKGITVDSALTSASEEAIYRQGLELGLTHEEIAHYLRDSGVGRTSEEELMDEVSRDFPATDAAFVDYYAILKVGPESTSEELEAAYRDRYRWARTLKDANKATAIYKDLEEAWKWLGDAKKRRVYDRRLRRQSSDSRSYRPSEDLSDPAIRSAPPILQEEPPAPPPPPARAVEARAVINLPGTPQAPISMAEVPRTTYPSVGTPLVSSVTESRSPLTATPVPSRGSRRSRLDPDLPEEMVFNHLVGKVTRKLVIRNVGKGPMTVSLTSNQDWLSVTPGSLDSVLEAAEVLLTIHPRRMTGRSGTAKLLLQTTHGDKHFILVRAARTRLLLPVVLLLPLLLGGFLAWATTTGRLAEWLGQAPEGDATLQLNIDPPAQAVFIDGRLVGSGESVIVSNPAPRFTDFKVRIEADGFNTWQADLQFRREPSLTQEVALELADPMSFRPRNDLLPADLPARKAEEIFATRAAAFERCFTGLAPGAPSVAKVEVRAWVSRAGVVTGVEFPSANLPVESVETCLKRQLRALRFPALSGDYAVVHHLFQVPTTTQEGTHAP